jgi:hypothetical protein
MRQIIYTSVSVASSGRASDECDAILRVSAARNGLDGITGLLYTEEAAFLQVIEGRDDARHRDLEILVDRDVPEREFGDWTMVHRARRETADDFDRRLRLILLGVSPQTAVYFRALENA